MDLSNPLRVIAPSVEGDVLVVLVRSHAPLTGARVASLAGRSETQVRDVLARLAQHGLVSAERHGNASSYTLNRQHVLAPGLESLAGAADTLEARIRDAVASWDPAPVAVLLFGSAARRSNDANSDIDLLVVRPDDVHEDAPDWSGQRHTLARNVETWSGNRVQILEMSDTELTDAIQQDEPLVASLAEEGVVLAGTSPLVHVRADAR